MKEVSLRNGGVVPDVAVTTVFLNVRSLMTDDPIAFWELVEVARDKDHRIFSEVQVKALRNRNLLDDEKGSMHSIIRDVVCSMVEGELPNITLVNPVEPTAAAGETTRTPED